MELRFPSWRRVACGGALALLAGASACNLILGNDGGRYDNGNDGGSTPSSGSSSSASSSSGGDASSSTSSTSSGSPSSTSSTSSSGYTAPVWETIAAIGRGALGLAVTNNKMYWAVPPNTDGGFPVIGSVYDAALDNGTPQVNGSIPANFAEFHQLTSSLPDATGKIDVYLAAREDGELLSLERARQDDFDPLLPEVTGTSVGSMVGFAGGVAAAWEVADGKRLVVDRLGTSETTALAVRELAANATSLFALGGSPTQILRFDMLATGLSFVTYEAPGAALIAASDEYLFLTGECPTSVTLCAASLPLKTDGLQEYNELLSSDDTITRMHYAHGALHWTGQNNVTSIWSTKRCRIDGANVCQVETIVEEETIAFSHNKFGVYLLTRTQGLWSRQP